MMRPSPVRSSGDGSPWDVASITSSGVDVLGTGQFVVHGGGPTSTIQSRLTSPASCVRSTPSAFRHVAYRASGQSAAFTRAGIRTSRDRARYPPTVVDMGSVTDGSEPC